MCAAINSESRPQQASLRAHRHDISKKCLKPPSIRKKMVFGVNQNYKCCSQWWVILGWVRVSYKGKSAIKEAGKPALVWLFQHKEDKSSVPTLHVHQSRKTAKWFNISGDMSVERKTASAECKQNQQRGRADARWNTWCYLPCISWLSNAVNWNDNYNYNMTLLEFSTIFTRP